MRIYIERKGCAPSELSNITWLEEWFKKRYDIKETLELKLDESEYNRLFRESREEYYRLEEAGEEEESYALEVLKLILKGAEPSKVSFYFEKV